MRIVHGQLSCLYILTRVNRRTHAGFAQSLIVQSESTLSKNLFHGHSREFFPTKDITIKRQICQLKRFADVFPEKWNV